ncbi:hypothetical protein ACFL12_06350 [Pseudomonadota bacterium]
MHRRIINPVLEELNSERAGYFTEVVTKIEEDPRTERFPNYVYTLLKETLPLLPTYLDKAEFIDLLFEFVTDNYAVMKRIMFDKAYIYDQSVLKDVTNDFVTKIVDRTLEHYEQGDIDTGEQDIRKFTWPYRAEDVIDLEDEEEVEALNKRPPYTGPERRKRR